MSVNTNINFNIFCVGNLNTYIYFINSLPILSYEQEYKLINDFYYYNNINSIKKLIIFNLKFVLNVAKNYLGYGIAISDLIQEGNIGLIKAIKKFNPLYKVRIISFAIYWIKCEIHEFILKNLRIVKIATTKSQRKLFFNLRKLKKKIGWLKYKEINLISKKLSVSKKDIYKMESRMFYNDINLGVNNINKYFDGNLFYNKDLLNDNLMDKNSNFTDNIEYLNWKKYILKKLKLAFINLDNRSKHIIKSRWLRKKKVTLKKLAEYYKISSERIRQLEKNAIKKLRFLIKNY